MKKLAKDIPNSLNAHQILNLLDEAKHTIPKMSSEIVGHHGLRWIKWGEKNLFPQRLTEAFQNSKTLRGVLNQKANLVAAELKTENPSLQKKIDKYTSPKTHYDLRQLIYRVALDIQLHGEGFIKEVRYVEYAGSTPIKERSFASHLDASQVRFSSDVDSVDLDPTAVWVSKNWEYYGRAEYRPVKLPLAEYGYEEYFDEQDRVYKKVTVHRIKSYEPGQQIYSRPDWLGAFFDVRLEERLQRFNYVHINNSIFLSGILNVEMPFQPDEQTSKEIRDRLIANLKTDNSGGPSTAVNISGGDGKLSMINYTMPGLDGSWRELGVTCSRNIIMSAGWHPSLMGIEESGKLGNAIREIETHHRRVMQYEIEPLQERILHTYLHTLEGTEYALLAEDSPIMFENKPMLTALDYVSQAKLDLAVPIEEVQKELGYVQEEEEELPQGTMSLEEVQRLLEVYGTAVRSGGVTPNINDEAALRKMMNLPDMNNDVRQGWIDERGVRKPTTLKNPSQNVEEVTEEAKEEIEE